MSARRLPRAGFLPAEAAVPGVAELPAAWRAEAEAHRSLADERGARLVERCARELEDALRRANDEALTLELAARESGYSVEHLRHLVAAGAIPNAGVRHRPRVRRGDLPRRPGARTDRAASGYDADVDALNIVGRARHAP